MNKCLFLTLVALSGSMIAQHHDLVSYMDATEDWTNPDTLQVIQKDASQQRCVRFIGTGFSHNNHQQAAIKDLPVTDVAKIAIALKLQKRADDMVSCSDCSIDSYFNFLSDIYYGRGKRTTIYEVPAQEIRDDVGKYDRLTFLRLKAQDQED